VPGLQLGEARPGASVSKGGARARSGPAPDPNALRRDRPSDGQWTHLPAAGRQGEAPEWPLSRVTRRELELWTREWRRPQAVMWEANGQHVEVALYVRSLVGAERPKASVALRTLVRQQQEALGLSLPGLLRNRWIIAGLPEPAREVPRGASSSVKDRMKLVQGG
jgi:hypothetical protein